MNTIIVKSQAQWDALATSFADFSIIEIRSSERISIGNIPGSSRVVALGSSRVVALGSSRVEARESSSVEAWGSSSVEAWESSRVVARESSSVVALGSSRVVARESSSVKAWGSSSVEAWESSRVEAWGSSSVEAFGQTTTHHRSTVKPQLSGQSVCFQYDKASAPLKKSKNCIVIKAKQHKGVAGWLEREGVMEVDGSSVILYKRVSNDMLTQENTENETNWKIGATLTVPNFDPSQECGPGKFHACSRPYFCDEFRSNAGDVYIAIRVAVSDLHAHDCGSYPHKIALRSASVLHLVDRWGEKITEEAHVNER